MQASSSFIPVEAEQKVYVIGDVHGCINTLKALLQQINFKGQSPLFLLGDYVNKGPSSVESLIFIIDLKQKYPSVYPLPGNHDLFLLDFLTRSDAEWLSSTVYRNMATKGEFDDLTELTRQAFITFIKALPFYYETERHLLVHAGFNFGIANPFQDVMAMVSTKSFTYDPWKAKHKQIVHGHLPVELDLIKKRIELNYPVIPIDNGCVYSGERLGMGHLCCLELKEMKLFIQARID